jgi:hypothetical protein
MTVASPFARLRAVALVAVAYGAACVVWIVAGASLPGGRWLAVHLFTLGVLTNLVLAMSDHFGRALTHAGGAAPAWQPIATNASILAILWGIPSANDVAVSVGATGITTVVLLSLLRLRRIRKAALGPRFGWVVRMYEHAHGAFVLGALLGALMGTAIVSGRWYGSARIAHLHANVLGWGGLTLLATVVTFGPTVARVRIAAGADATAARALRLGAMALLLAVVALFLTGIGGGLATGFRWLAAIGLAVYAWATTLVCAGVGRAMRRAEPSAGRWSVLATAIWFPIVAWADVAIVASNALRFLDALGIAMLVGVLAQAIVASLGYVAPLFRASGSPREALRSRLEIGAAVRALAWNAGVVIVVAATASHSAAAPTLARVGWALVLGSLAAAVALVLSAVGARGEGARGHDSGLGQA